MKWLWVLCALTMLQGCYKNERDALAKHQIIDLPCKRWVTWEQEAPVDVTEERVQSTRSCNQET